MLVIPSVDDGSSTLKYNSSVSEKCVQKETHHERIPLF